MAHLNTTVKRFTYPVLLPGAWDSATLSGNLVLTRRSGQYQLLDPGGGHRDVTLPAVAPEDDGYFFEVANAADAAENLVVKDAGGNTIGTVSQNDLGIFYVDAAGAWQLFFMISGAPA